MKQDSNDSTFMKITNKDIYCKLIEIENHVKMTNGKVKLNRWVATTALALALVSIKFLMNV
jgi:hypothetical protein